MAGLHKRTSPYWLTLPILFRIFGPLSLGPKHGAGVLDKPGYRLPAKYLDLMDTARSLCHSLELSDLPLEWLTFTGDPQTVADSTFPLGSVAQVEYFI